MREALIVTRLDLPNRLAAKVRDIDDVNLGVRDIGISAGSKQVLCVRSRIEQCVEFGRAAVAECRSG
jgi:hypothetical protein